MQLKIKWIEMEFMSSIVGVCECDENFYIFQTKNFSKNNINKNDPKENKYELFKIEDYEYDILLENRKQYCEKMNQPLFHGEPYKILETEYVNSIKREDSEKLLKEKKLKTNYIKNDNTYKEYEHFINILSFISDRKSDREVNFDEFTNFYVPRIAV